MPSGPWGGALDPVTGRRAYTAPGTDGQAPVEAEPMQNSSSVKKPVWRPADEAAATSNMAAFIEWRRATAAHAPGGPAEIWAWAARAPEEFADALIRFAGLDSAQDYAGALAQAMGRRGAIVLLDPRQRIDAAALLAGEVPACIAAMLKTADSAALAQQAADHLLRLELRPDQRVLWPGPPDQCWPLGALLAGGTLLLSDTPPTDPEGLAAAEGAVLLRRPV